MTDCQETKPDILSMQFMIFAVNLYSFILILFLFYFFFSTWTTLLLFLTVWDYTFFVDYLKKKKGGLFLGEGGENNPYLY